MLIYFNKDEGTKNYKFIKYLAHITDIEKHNHDLETKIL